MFCLKITAARRRRREGAFGQALALRDVEHRKAFEERHCFRLVTVAPRPFALVVGDEAVGIDDSGPAFALAHRPAQAQGLPQP